LGKEQSLTWPAHFMIEVHNYRSPTMGTHQHINNRGYSKLIQRLTQRTESDTWKVLKNIIVTTTLWCCLEPVNLARFEHQHNEQQENLTKKIIFDVAEQIWILWHNKERISMVKAMDSSEM